MCGLAGFLDARLSLSQAEAARLARHMADALVHRGPDDGGSWADAEAGVGLGHRRLAIVDLTPAGAQPMVSACSRYVIVYNGEVYNAAELRADMPDIAFRGHSDTEAIVEGIARWGVEATAKRLIGMFAIVVWDRATRTLSLVRDRLGIKPLYWGRMGGAFLFGSELKALRCHPAFAAEVDRDALASYVRHNYVPAPQSIYRGIRKLRPGCVLTVRAGEEPVEAPFWSMEEVARQGLESRRTVSDAEAIDGLEALLRDAVGRRMISDVPIGAFLSGGVDSSVVVALMQAQSSRPVRTFSIGFHESGYDEAPHAAAVARHLNTDHTEFYVSAAQAQAVIPLLPQMFDEPFADSSQIPTYLVSQLARQHVTVSLSGDGGDELFAGYTRYAAARDLWQRIARVPGAARVAAGLTIGAVPAAGWDRLFALVPGLRRRRGAGEKLHDLATVLRGGPDALYRLMVSHWSVPEALVPGSREAAGPLSDPAMARLFPDHVERMQYLDTVTYLPDDILTKVDRASMAVSLEARVPLLDHRVVEYAWRLPNSFKMRDGDSKWVLRQVLHRHVPRALLDRPKMGFGIPVGEWLRGPLRDWAEALLDERRLREEGYFDPAPIRRRWADHLAGRHDWQYPMWTILMFQAWLDRWRAA